ncbi:MAG: capsid protein [Pseudomonadota bacterium]
MTIRPFVTDPILTAVAIGYTNTAAMRIADRVLPRTPVAAETFKWTHYPIEEAFNTPETLVGRRGQVQQLEFGGEERESAVEDHGLDSSIPNSDIQAANEARSRGVTIHDPEKHATMMLTETIENAREARVGQMVFNADNYAVGRKEVLSGTDQFSDYDNSDPIEVLKDAGNSTLIYRPNTHVYGREAWSKIASHPKLVNAVKGNVTGSGMISMEQYVQLFSGEGVTQVLVGDGWVNTAKRGQPVNLQRAWGKHCALLYLDPIATTQGGVTFGFTAELGGRIAGRIEDPDVGLQGGVRIRAGERVKELIVAEDVGYFIQNVIA